MAQNTYIKARKFAAMIVGALARDTVLPMAFTRYDGRGFIGAEDDTVTFKLPGVTTARDYEWRTRTAPIVLDKIGRTSVSIKLDTHVYNAVPITDEEQTLDLQDYGAEILTPQIAAVRERLENKTIAALRAEPFKTTTLAPAEADDPYQWALYVKGVLDQQGTPKGGRNLILGTNALNWLLTSDRVVQMDSQQATTAFREASIARVAQMNVLDGGQLLDPNEVFAVHSSALVVANLAPGVVDGVAWGARARYQGFSFRVVKDYDVNYARNRSFVNTFAGWSGVRDEYQTDANGLVLDAEGNPQITGNNVRGARGAFVPAV